MYFDSATHPFHAVYDALGDPVCFVYSGDTESGEVLCAELDADRHIQFDPNGQVKCVRRTVAAPVILYPSDETNVCPDALRWEKSEP